MSTHTDPPVRFLGQETELVNAYFEAIIAWLKAARSQGEVGNALNKTVHAAKKSFRVLSSLRRGLQQYGSPIAHTRRFMKTIQGLRDNDKQVWAVVLAEAMRSSWRPYEELKLLSPFSPCATIVVLQQRSIGLIMQGDVDAFFDALENGCQIQKIGIGEPGDRFPIFIAVTRT